VENHDKISQWSGHHVLQLSISAGFDKLKELKKEKVNIEATSFN
jgi:hypothetical protein